MSLKRSSRYTDIIGSEGQKWMSILPRRSSNCFQQKNTSYLIGFVGHLEVTCLSLYSPWHIHTEYWTKLTWITCLVEPKSENISNWNFFRLASNADFQSDLDFLMNEDFRKVALKYFLWRDFFSPCRNSYRLFSFQTWK